MQVHDSPSPFLPPAADLDQCVTVYVCFYGSCNAAEAEHRLQFLFSTAPEQFGFFSLRRELLQHNWEGKTKQMSDVFFFSVLQFVDVPWVIIHVVWK